MTTSLRLIKAYATGDYRVIPWESLLPAVAAVVYLVMPIDTIPDITPGFGWLDDAVLFAWVAKAIAADLDAFLEWESTGCR